MPDDIGTFEPDDLAYEAFVDECLSAGVDPGQAVATDWQCPDWDFEPGDIPFEDVILSAEDIPF